MSLPEQQEWISFKKLRANRLYRLSHYEEAIDSYMEALTGSIILNEQQAVVIMLCNLSSCLISLTRYTLALDLLDHALSTDSANPRALERKGFALMNMGKEDEALVVLKTAASVCKDKRLANTISVHLAKVTKQRTSQKELYKRMVRNEGSPERQDVGWLEYISAAVGSVFSLCRRRTSHNPA